MLFAILLLIIILFLESGTDHREVHFLAYGYAVPPSNILPRLVVAVFFPLFPAHGGVDALPRRHHPTRLPASLRCRLRFVDGDGRQEKGRRLLACVCFRNDPTTRRIHEPGGLAYCVISMSGLSFTSHLGRRFSMICESPTPPNTTTIHQHQLQGYPRSDGKEVSQHEERERSKRGKKGQVSCRDGYAPLPVTEEGKRTKLAKVRKERQTKNTVLDCL